MAIKTYLSLMLLFLSFHISGLAASSSNPEGVEWFLADMNGKPVATSTERSPGLRLDPDQQKASGFAGCNTFNAAYTLESYSLKFGPLAATRRACHEEVAAVENGFLKMLGEVREWEVVDGLLVLMDGTGNALARFSEKKPDGLAADLKSMTMRSAVFSSGTVTLSDGEYRMPAVPGSASEIFVKLTDHRVFGELDGDEIGAVILTSSSGGSGTFFELALLTKADKGWENTDTVLIGDRVKIYSVAIQENSIVVSMTTHGPGDPMCCPTLEATKTFKVQENRFVAANEPVADESALLKGNVWQWVQTLYGDGEKTIPGKPENYTVQFREDGNIDAKADCNRKSGNYTIRGKKMTVTVTISTMAMCEEGSLEEPFVKDLTAADSFILKDGELYLDLKFDSGTMKFSKGQ